MGSGATGARGIEVLLRQAGGTRESVAAKRSFEQLRAHLFGHAQPAVTLSRYVVLDAIGSGGLGVVYCGYDPKLDRTVAIKVLRATGVGDRRAADAGRLLREAQAMARVSHPNVVQVYDVGTFAGGEFDVQVGADDDAAAAHDVFMVMELVDGVDLRTWLTQARRSWREIIPVLLDAGRGLAAAHSMGLIHRDFKPENVLVASDGRARVLDFGLAREVELGPQTPPGGTSGNAEEPETLPAAEAAIRGPSTKTGSVMGTPRYMAPEQHRGERGDTRTDQYAFCVVAYEALYGKPPFSGATVRALAKEKQAGHVIEHAAGELPRHIAEALLQGLRPDPTKRWPTLPALLSELARRRRRVRRPIVAVSLLGAAAVGVVSFSQVQRSRMLAACAAEGERIREVYDDARADEIAAAFESTGIIYATDTWARSRQRLDAYAAEWTRAQTEVCVQSEVEAVPEDAARASHTCLDEQRAELDILLEQLAEPDEAVVENAVTAAASLPLLHTCTNELRLGLRPVTPVDREIRKRVRALQIQLLRASAAEATGRYPRALQRAESVFDEATELDWAPLITEARLAMGRAHQRLGHYEVAEAAFEHAFFEAEATGRDDLALHAAVSLVYVVGYQLARYDEGLRWSRSAQVLVDRSGESEGLAAAELLNNIGNVHFARGAYSEAEKLYEQALAIRAQALGSAHPRVAGTLNNLAGVHNVQGRHAEARELYQRALAIWEQSLGPSHPGVAATLNNLGNVHRAEGSHRQAQRLHERALAILERTFGVEHPHVANVLNSLGMAYYEQQHYVLAQVQFERALHLWEELAGQDHPHVAMVINNIGNIFKARGEYAEAQRFYERALTIQQRTLGPEHREVAMSLHNLGSVHKSQGAYAQALALFERALVIEKKSHGAEHPAVAKTLHSVGNLQYAKEAYWLAVAAYTRALAIRESADVPPSEVAETRYRLARALWDAGGDRTRARELAILARDASASEARVRVEAWLHAHTHAE
jgi:serine/threonine protein kinase/tetratricopeptide (TPR) repeat protein